MRQPSETERDGLAAEALKRSGSELVLEYPVEAAGITVCLCRLNDEDWRAAADAIFTGDRALKDTGVGTAIARARLWPEQEAVRAACAEVPNLRDHLWSAIERLGGGAVEFLRVVDVTPTLDESAVRELGIDPGRIAVLRKQYLNPKMLKIASYRDDEMSIEWACVLKLPSDHVLRTMLDNVRQRGHEAATTFAVNAIVEPGREGVAGFVRGENRIAQCLWPTLTAWAQQAAAARPTILRPRSNRSGTSTPQPT